MNVFVVIITPFPGAAPVIVDDVATQQDAVNFILAYKTRVDARAVGAIIPVNKRPFPTMGVAE